MDLGRLRQVLQRPEAPSGPGGYRPPAAARRFEHSVPSATNGPFTEPVRDPRRRIIATSELVSSLALELSEWLLWRWVCIGHS